MKQLELANLAFCAGYASNENAGIPRYFPGGLPAGAAYVSNLQFWQPANKPTYCKHIHMTCPLHKCNICTLSFAIYYYDEATSLRKNAEKYAAAIETRKANEQFRADPELNKCVDSIIGNE